MSNAGNIKAEGKKQFFQVTAVYIKEDFVITDEEETLLKPIRKKYY